MTRRDTIRQFMKRKPLECRLMPEGMTPKQEQAYYLTVNDPFFSDELAGIIVGVLNREECKQLREEIAAYKNGLLGRVYKQLMNKIETEGQRKTIAFIREQHDAYTAAMEAELRN